MTFSRWGDIPAGMHAHFHCLATLELHHDPKFWTDASATPPDYIAWNPDDLVAWAREQCEKHLPDVVEPHLSYWEEWLPAGSERWAHLYRTAQMGRWAIHAEQIRPGRKLVLQMVCYADPGSPTGFGGKRYEVCGQHRRPAGKPYTGLTASQREHFEKYSALYQPA